MFLNFKTELNYAGKYILKNVFYVLTDEKKKHTQKNNCTSFIKATLYSNPRLAFTRGFLLHAAHSRLFLAGRVVTRDGL